MRFAVDSDGSRVCIDDVERDEVFFCQECGEKLVQRRGKIKAHHFAHYPNTKCVDLWHYDESDWHSEMESLFPKEFQEIVLEKDEKKHRADVLIKDRNLVIEFQKERLNSDEFKSRNEFFTSFGFRVLWVFDESLNFQTGAISPYGNDGGIYRDWKRPSRVFSEFSLQKEANIELWFRRQEFESHDEKAFFRISREDEIRGFRGLYCDCMYSRAEFLTYLLEGKRIVDRGKIVDHFISIRRNNGEDYFFGCPLSDNGFGLAFNCSGCPNCVHISINRIPKSVACSGRGKLLDLGPLNEITDTKSRLDGFVTEIVGKDINGNPIVVDANPPKTALRTLGQLWDRYRPLKTLRCYNVKTERIFQVFNPDWQKRTTGVIKGKMVNIVGKVFPGEVEIYGAEEPVWVVVWFARPEKRN